ncbi:hypothetical protein [Flavobacterium collinsii]|uniref:Uncharacterized protein n=1 Tax=Flavobacterium collinsii TaxID=1114861 RepID=A0A9W4XEZ6_9FLAO|nr:hypothetical protein [Flavobacterium collinsii]CAI2767680.1 conserved protein of unknown function [Flavobacterium collinsii]
MNTTFYLEKFQEAADRLDQKILSEKSIEVAVGIYLDSVFIKLYKKSWSTNPDEALTSESRIFFSVWISDSDIEKQRLMYNIHALKLRKFKVYTIESRKFAEVFRKSFKTYENGWPNVTTNHGPLTLMEGWLNLDLENLQEEIVQLSNNFLEIEHLIDAAFDQFK